MSAVITRTLLAVGVIWGATCVVCAVLEAGARIQRAIKGETNE